MTEQQAIKQAIRNEPTHQEKERQFEVERLNQIFDLKDIKKKWGQSATD